jgi:hypothetical protein
VSGPFSFSALRTHFRRYRGRRVPFSCFALPDSFSAVRKASGPVIMLSCFALPDSFSMVRTASGPVIMFCAPGLIFGGMDDIRSYYHVVRSRTHYQRYRGRRVPDPFSTVPRASGPVLKFCPPEPVFGGTKGVRSHFRGLCSRTHFRRYRRRRVPYTCFALPEPFSSIPSTSGPVFMFSAPGLIFGGTDGVGSRFHVLRSRTCFRRSRQRRVPFSCIALPDSYSAGARTSGQVYMFCAPEPDFRSIDGFRSRFHVLRSRTHFRRYRRRRVPFSLSVFPDSFSVVTTASRTVIMFCAPGLIFGGIEGVRSRFHVLRARTHFRRYRGRRVSLSCFALPDSF